MKKRITALGVVMFSALTLVACGNEAETEVEPQVTAVAVEEVYEGSLLGSNRFIGQVQAGGQSAIIPKIPGELVEVNVKKGDTVEEGQVLAKVNDQDLRLQLEADEAQLAQARNGLKRAENGKTQAQANVSQAEASLNQARQGLMDAKSAQSSQQKAIEQQIKEAQQTVDQLTRSLAEGGASEEQVKQAEQLLQSLLASQQGSGSMAGAGQSLSSIEATVEQAKKGVELAEASTTDADLAIQDAKRMVEQAEKAVERSRERLDDAVIRADVSGELLAVEGEVGDIVSQQAPFAQIISLDTATVSVNVTADQLAYFNEGQEVDVEVSSVSGTQTGVVSYIASSVGETRLFPVEVELASPDEAIRQGMVATIFTEEVLVENERIVPTEAILEGQGRAFVYVVEDDVAREIDVEVIRFDSELSAIRGEIEVGAEVIVKGQHLIEDGSVVRINREV
ncbi:efflux RND transporter periplasmic adaptor subunit [Bacillus suaedae]|uniref:Efflux RND transporter periplasmic adaptor subunit n=1 Tax=Halalkalibacter suaedae TaxID=2822140 RepID=A0A940WVI2_9BACI|nr:efflux RND transporter periplasmic adaptor subunit [Bacillus suaedae]MBP3953180.1 efflux RND transporter periplasmic adaptor subunit [Bacillus suaedae]